MTGEIVIGVVATIILVGLIWMFSIPSHKSEQDAHKQYEQEWHVKPTKKSKQETGYLTGQKPTLKDPVDQYEFESRPKVTEILDAELCPKCNGLMYKTRYGWQCQQCAHTIPTKDYVS